MTATATTQRTASSARTAPLRLTVRGRRVLAALVLAPAAMGVGAVLFTAQPADASSAEANVAFEMVTVRSGETLWEIAEDHAGDRDVRDVVREIVELNGLEGQQVEPGMHLAMPLS